MGGAGGTGTPGDDGAAGSLGFGGMGGDAGVDSGGGGGGGYYGGGGGEGGLDNTNSGAGGGGGSSYTGGVMDGATVAGVQIGNGQIILSILGDISYSDAVEPGNCANEATITRTWTATDACGNSSTCNQIITVIDETAPTITFCPANTTSDCDDDSDIEALGNAEASDNCVGEVEISHSDLSTQGDNPDECNYYSYTIRTFTAEDRCGNANTCVQSHYRM
jgi:hypothetical protein